MDDGAPHPPTSVTRGAPPAPDQLPAPSPSRRDRLLGPLLTAGLVGGFTGALHLRDPHGAGSWGFCPWLAVTGHYCPGCGGLRAVNDLTNGDVLGALSSNLLFVALIPVLVVWWLGWASRAWAGAGGSGRGARHPGVWIAVFALVMLTFGVLRNLPAGSWLAP